MSACYDRPSGGQSTGGGHLFPDDGYLVDDRLVYDVASAGAAIAHATTSGSTWHRRWLHHPSDATPTPHEAVRRLARFIEKVQLKQMSPLVASPPRQKVAATRQPLLKRSRRIAAQPLAHISTSKRGEVLLIQRMGFAPPAAPISSVSKRAYDDLFARNLTSSEIEALDVLFPATNTRTGRKLFSDDGVGSHGQ